MTTCNAWPTGFQVRLILDRSLSGGRLIKANTLATARWGEGREGFEQRQRLPPVPPDSYLLAGHPLNSCQGLIALAVPLNSCQGLIAIRAAPSGAVSVSLSARPTRSLSSPHLLLEINLGVHMGVQKPPTTSKSAPLLNTKQ